MVSYNTRALFHSNQHVIRFFTLINLAIIRFFTLINLAVPGLVGEAAAFNRRYQNPIALGQDRDATEEEIQKGSERLTELLGLCGRYMLRRCGDIIWDLDTV